MTAVVIEEYKPNKTKMQVITVLHEAACIQQHCNPQKENKKLQHKILAKPFLPCNMINK